MYEDRIQNYDGVSCLLAAPLEICGTISLSRPVPAVDDAYPTRGYTRTHRLPARLQLGLLGKCVVSLCVARCGIVGVTRPNVSDSTPTLNGV